MFSVYWKPQTAMYKTSVQGLVFIYIYEKHTIK